MANNIVMKITDYIAHLWHDTDNDIVMAENVNGWENTLQQHAEFLKRFSWQPNTAYPKNSVLLYPFGLHTKLVSKMLVQVEVMNQHGRKQVDKKVPER